MAIKANSEDAKKSADPMVDQFDRSLLLERLEGDHDLLAELIKLFLADMPKLLEAMRNALHDGDMPALERAAHSLRGAAGSLSARATASAASKLEHSARDGNVETAKAGLAVVEAAVERLVPTLMDLCPELSA